MKEKHLIFIIIGSILIAFLFLVKYNYKQFELAHGHSRPVLIPKAPYQMDVISETKIHGYVYSLDVNDPSILLLVLWNQNAKKNEGYLVQLNENPAGYDRGIIGFTLGTIYEANNKYASVEEGLILYGCKGSVLNVDKKIKDNGIEFFIKSNQSDCGWDSEDVKKVMLYDKKVILTREQ
ncbi:MAG: hypothetical protein ABFD79_04090 [Phycisphaerales bacterium]